MTTINVLVAGSAGTGKTAFINRITKGNFIKEYTPTTEWGISMPLKLHTTEGVVSFSIREYPSAAACVFGSTIDALIVFVNFDNCDSVVYAKTAISKIKHKHLVICHSFIDIDSVRYYPCNCGFPLEAPYFAVSARTSCRLEAPWLAIIRAWFNNKEIWLEDSPVIEAPTINVAAPKINPNAKVDLTELMQSETAQCASRIMVEIVDSKLKISFEF